jgi:hypothetical protein
MTDSVSLDDALAYLRAQIPPEDAGNPCYRDIQRQIDALVQAKVTLHLITPPRYVIRDGKLDVLSAD